MECLATDELHPEVKKLQDVIDSFTRNLEEMLTEMAPDVYSVDAIGGNIVITEKFSTDLYNLFEATGDAKGMESHKHAQWEYLIVLAGEMDFEMNDQVERYKPMDFIRVKPNTPHRVVKYYGPILQVGFFVPPLKLQN